MDINNIYITGHIIKNIIDILDLEDKISFTTCNKSIYEKYYDNIKVDIYKYVNNDYKYFKRFINTFKYDILTIKTLGLFPQVGLFWRVPFLLSHVQAGYGLSCYISWKCLLPV